MSVASEFPPEVHIPDRARRSQPGGQARPRHLALVGVPGAGRPVPQAGAVRTAAYAAPARLRVPVRVPAFAEGRLDRPTLDRPTVGAGALRLTRRGIAVLVLGTVLLATLMLTVAHLSAGTSAASASRATLVGADSVTVQPGDTLWSIAQRVRPDRDPRAVVDRLRELNHLNGVVLVPGQTLKLG